jgi:opacity protein-like surface antigen
MKKTLLTLSFLALVQLGYGQWKKDWSIGYAFAAPLGMMKQTINQGNGITTDFYFLSPNKRFALGVDLNYSVYGFDQSRQQYSFPDGTTADMDVNVTNSFLNGMFSARYNLMKGKMLTPYVGIKGGYSRFRTLLTINDPDDLDSCEPVEKDILLTDGSWIYSLGGGVSYDLSSLFKKTRPDFLFINLSAYYTQGGEINYMNTDAPSANHMGSTSRSHDLEATFINTQTQIIHKHHVGNVYTDALRMMDIRFSLTFRFPH